MQIRTRGKSPAFDDSLGNNDKENYECKTHNVITDWKNKRHFICVTDPVRQKAKSFTVKGWLDKCEYEYV